MSCGRNHFNEVERCLYSKENNKLGDKTNTIFSTLGEEKTHKHENKTLGTYIKVVAEIIRRCLITSAF